MHRYQRLMHGYQLARFNQYFGRVYTHPCNIEFLELKTTELLWNSPYVHSLVPGSGSVVMIDTETSISDLDCFMFLSDFARV